jgi:hypothetical protein
MGTRRIRKHPEADELFPSRKGYDPLRAARLDAGSFNRSWLKHGELMPPVQRIGYAVFSLAFIGAGLFLLNGGWEVMRSGDATFVLWFFASLAFVSLGALGLRNVFRFKKSGSE